MNELGFDRHAMFDAYIAGQNDRCADLMIDTWRFLDSQAWAQLDDNGKNQINQFVKSFLTIFVQPDFTPADRHFEPLIRLNSVISNIVAVTPYKNTDNAVRVCKLQKNAAKLMVLCNARNTVSIDRKLFFNANAGLASLWHCAFAVAYRNGLVNETVVKNLQKHYRNIDHRLQPDHEINESYFGSTYVDGACDLACKQAINRHMRMSPTLRLTMIRNKPNPKKIAVISGHWRKGHSVHRTLSAYVEALKPDYHLTLVLLLDDLKQKYDTALFDEVREIDMRKNPIDFAPIAQNEWGGVYYPDVGMSLHSVLLSSLRIAPVQVLGTGHPVSTCGSEIDYFVSGQEVELPAAAKFYSERLVLLPGMGAVYDRPEYEEKENDPKISDLKASELWDLIDKAQHGWTVQDWNDDRKPPRKPDDPIRIACSWYGQKINGKLIGAVQKIIVASKRQLVWRIFSGAVAARNNGYLAYVQEMRQALPDANVEIIQHLNYPEYMASMAECDFAADCWHFGGSNTCSDLLHIRKPVVVLNGERWYGRIGAALVKRAGIPELVAQSEDEYVKLVLKMANDDAFREQMTKRLEESNLDAVYSREEAKAFKRMFDYLIENHDRLKNEYGNEALVME